MIFNPSSRAQVRVAERHWVPKLACRLVAIGLALIAIGISAYTLSSAFGITRRFFLGYGGLLWLALIPVHFYSPLRSKTAGSDITQTALYVSAMEHRKCHRSAMQSQTNASWRQRRPRPSYTDSILRE